MQNKTWNIHRIFTNQFIHLLKKGILLWRIPWDHNGLPKNFVTNEPYRGVNIPLLVQHNFDRNYFLTYEEVQQLGGKIKKGERSQIVLNKEWELRFEAPDVSHNARYYANYNRVFNIEQCQGLQIKGATVQREKNPLKACYEIIENMLQPPAIEYGGFIPSYNMQDDTIVLPHRVTQIEKDVYFSQLFTMLMLSTAHPRRLGRSIAASNSTDRYSKEILISQFGSCYLQSSTNMVFNNGHGTPGYSEGWIERLRRDSTFILYACAEAQRATDYLLKVETQSKAISASLGTYECGKANLGAL